MSVLSIANGIDVSLVPCGFRGAAYSLLSTYSDAGKFPIVFLTESSTTFAWTFKSKWHLEGTVSRALTIIPSPSP